jgi:SAM-dependent methyltransferase
MDARAHYETHLAAHYSWIYGGFDVQRARNAEFFASRGIAPKSTGIAIDLGAGSGFQSVPLAEAGFQVIAVDFSAKLLGELRERAGGLAIQTIESDMLDFASYSGKRPEIIVCMGDTLTHLAAPADVDALLARAHSELVSGGRLLLTFRDLSVELKGSDRFIPVRSERDRIFTCVLEYGTTHVTVNDLVHERTEQGWKMSVSAYRKLRLQPEMVRDRMASIGFRILEYGSDKGMVTLTGGKE